eukprot:5708007-Prymnesium_polylepis.1
MPLCEDLDPAVCETIGYNCLVGKPNNPALRSSCPRSCGLCTPDAPRVYIYPNEELERARRALRPTPLRHANGSRVGVHNFLADQGLQIAFYDDLKPFVVSEPSKADVFFAFMVPHTPPFHEYTAEDRAAMDAMGPARTEYIPNDMRLALQKQCEAIHEPRSAFVRSLTHLRPTSAPRHFIVSELPASGVPRLRTRGDRWSHHSHARVTRAAAHTLFDSCLRERAH